MKSVLRYLWRILQESLQAVLPICLFLLLFQFVILRTPIENVSKILMGLVLVVIGLTVFMEGIKYGLMPLGEDIGSTLPKKSGMWLILIFAVLIGFGATMAEPAISALKMAGGSSTVRALEHKLLVPAIGIGVGLAVALGMLRIAFNFNLAKPIIPSIIVCIMLSIATFFDFVSVGWDAGAVTTGPVTVPLVLALGVGLSTIMGRSDTGMAGFGIVTLASLMPIIMVLLLGMVPAP